MFYLYRKSLPSLHIKDCTISPKISVNSCNPRGGLHQQIMGGCCSSCFGGAEEQTVLTPDIVKTHSTTCAYLHIYSALVRIHITFYALFLSLHSRRIVVVFKRKPPSAACKRALPEGFEIRATWRGSSSDRRRWSGENGSWPRKVDPRLRFVSAC